MVLSIANNIGIALPQSRSCLFYDRCFAGSFWAVQYKSQGTMLVGVHIVTLVVESYHMYMCIVPCINAQTGDTHTL